MEDINAVWTEYRTLHGATCKRPDRLDFLYSHYFSDITAVRVAELQRTDVRRWFRSVHAKHGAVSANRALGLLRAMINWAMREEVIELPANPAANVALLPERARERFMLPEESQRLRVALDSEPLWRDFFYTLLLSGARRSNVLSMRWQDIDTTLRVWVIPAAEFKTGRTHHLPLTPALLAILERRAQSRNSEWVFPAKDPAKHLIEPKSAWTRITKRANITGLRIHDLRRSLASYMAMDGSSLLMIGAALGHADPSSTAIYARLSLNPIREAMGKAGKAMMSQTSENDEPADSAPCQLNHNTEPALTQARNEGYKVGCEEGYKGGYEEGRKAEIKLLKTKIRELAKRHSLNLHG